MLINSQKDDYLYHPSPTSPSLLLLVVVLSTTKTVKVSVVSSGKVHSLGLGVVGPLSFASSSLLLLLLLLLLLFMRRLDTGYRFISTTTYTQNRIINNIEEKKGRKDQYFWWVEGINNKKGGEIERIKRRVGVRCRANDNCR